MSRQVPPRLPVALSQSATIDSLDPLWTRIRPQRRQEVLEQLNADSGQAIGSSGPGEGSR
jgi:hypothetical protein